MGPWTVKEEKNSECGRETAKGSRLCFSAGWAELVFAGIFFAVLIFAAVWPVCLHPGEQFIGDYQGDFWKHSWGHWWVNQCINKGIIPLFCDSINAPRGGYLFIADPCNAVFVSLFLPFMSLPAAHNLLICVNLWLGLMAAWMLADYFIKDKACSMAAAVIYGLSAYVLSYPVSSGVTETLNTAWAPLYILFLHRLLDRGSFKDFLGSAVFFALTTFSCWYYGEFMAVYTACALIYKTVGNIAFHWRGRTFSFIELVKFERIRSAFLHRLNKCLKKAFPDLKHSFFKAALAVILGGLMVLPFAAAFKLVVSDYANIVMPTKAPKRSIFNMKDYMGNDSARSVNNRGINGFHNYTNVLGWIMPGKGNATVTVTIDRLVRVHYLGFTALILAAAAWKKRKNDRNTYYFGAVFIFFLIMSLGPRITISDFSAFGFLNPVYMLMFICFPFLYNIAIPFRFLMIALIGLGILASLGTKEILKDQTSLKRWFFASFISVGILIEILFVSPLPWPLPISPSEVPDFYHILAADERDYAVIDYPFERPDSRLIPSEYFYYQTIHRKKIPYRTSGVLSPETAHSSFMEEVLLAQNGVQASWQTEENLKKGTQLLVKMGFKYFILHENMLSGFSAVDIENRLIPVLGEPMHFGSGIVVFPLVLKDDSKNGVDQ